MKPGTRVKIINHHHEIDGMEGVVVGEAIRWPGLYCVEFPGLGPYFHNCDGQVVSSRGRYVRPEEMISPENERVERIWTALHSVVDGR